MTQENVERVEDLQKQLREMLPQLDAPVITLKGYDEECWIVANAAGHLRLALDVLEASRGRDMDFETPLGVGQPTCQVLGLKFDSEPELVEARNTPRYVQWIGFGLILGVIGIFGVGFIEVLLWLSGLAGRLFFR